MQTNATRNTWQRDKRRADFIIVLSVRQLIEK